MTSDAYRHAMQSLPSPCLLIDEPGVLSNIQAFQAHCDQAGLALRPHIKTHKSVRFAHAQLAAGAIGINCQKLGEAEIMADAGADDILITFNLLGADKLARLTALARRVARLSVTVDNAVVLDGLAAAFAGHDDGDGGARLGVLIECDTGAGRCGVQTPEAAVALARQVAQCEGLAFRGLMTYPKPGGATDAAAFMTRTRELLGEANLPCEVISTGGTPDMWQAATAGVFTEYRIGTYIYNDRSLIERGTCAEDDCVARVIATVVSRPTPTRLILDAGSKTLSSDLLGLQGHGRVVGHPDAAIVALSEEHGTVSVPPDCPLQVGERVEVIPNHVCVVSNLLDNAWLVTTDGHVERLPIDARGCVT